MAVDGTNTLAYAYIQKAIKKLLFCRLQRETLHNSAVMCQNIHQRLYKKSTTGLWTCLKALGMVLWPSPSWFLGVWSDHIWMKAWSLGGFTLLRLHPDWIRLITWRHISLVSISMWGDSWKFAQKRKKEYKNKKKCELGAFPSSGWSGHTTLFLSEDGGTGNLR